MVVSQPSILRQVPTTVGAEQRCPWCDQPIPHERYDEIHARIAAKERERTAQVERQLREQLAREKIQIEAQAKTAVEQARKSGAAAMAALKKTAAVKEAAAREAGKKAAEAAVAPKLAGLDKAKKAAERQLLDVQAKQDKVLTLRLREQREALEKAKTEAVSVEKSKAFHDRQKLEGQLQALQRQLQQKTAEELGEGAEVDLFERLKGEFPEDRVRRVGKGNPGADIIHEVILHGRVGGRLVYDSKNRSAWRNGYVTKLRKDQLAANADHAILTTQVFPSGARQIHLQDGVIIANPARAIVLVHMLRKHILQTDALRLSNEARTEKTSRLYEFITSDRFGQLLEEVETLTEDLLELDVKEHKAHETTWNRRGQLLRTVQKARGTIASEIEQIIGTAPTGGS